MTRSELARLDDAEIVRRADELFCDCDAGMALRRLYERRFASWRNFAKMTKAQNDANAGLRRALALEGAEVPAVLHGLSLNSLIAAAKDNSGRIDPAKVAALAAAQELRTTGEVTSATGKKKRSLLIWGKESGIGKTGALVPVFEAWQKKGRDCLFISFPDLVEQVRAGFKDEKWHERLERARTVDVLFLDDIGFPDRNASDHVREVAISIMRHRQGEVMTTLMTSNLTPDDLAKQLGDPLYRRIAEMAVVVEMGGRVLSDLG